MKPSFIALFFLFAFIASSAKAQVVLDAQGEPLLNGGTYYILPHKSGPLSGGLTFAITGNETCPLSVKPSRFVDDNGLAWRIQNLVITAALLANNPLIISVQGTLRNCFNSDSEWTIVEGEDETMSVKITGYENTVKGMFQIQEYGSKSYKIVFCHGYTRDSCKGVGLSDNGLVLTDDAPLGVVFKAASFEVSKQRINNVLEA